VVSTLVSGGGREDAAHAEKDAEIARLRHELDKSNQYAAALFRDHDRERKALYEIESVANLDSENSLLAPIVAEYARTALRNYTPNLQGGAG